MYAYVVTAICPAYGEDSFKMLVYHEGSKHAAAAEIASADWTVKRVRLATAEDIQDLRPHKEVIEKVESAVKQRREAERQRLAHIAAQEVERLAQVEANDRQRRQVAMAKAIGDVQRIRPEPEAKGNARITALCAKGIMFFDHAKVNKRDLFTSISIDSAEIQSQSNLPNAVRMVELILRSMNEYLEIDDGVAEVRQNVAAHGASTDNKVNSIASRTHIFGGSGWGLLLSACLADSAVRNDQKAIGSVMNNHNEIVRRAELAFEEARLRQSLLEFRAKAALSKLLNACGKAMPVNLQMPAALERYVLESV